MLHILESLCLSHHNKSNEKLAQFDKINSWFCCNSSSISSISSLSRSCLPYIPFNQSISFWLLLWLYPIVQCIFVQSSQRKQCGAVFSSIVVVFQYCLHYNSIYLSFVRETEANKESNIQRLAPTNNVWFRFFTKLPLSLDAACVRARSLPFYLSLSLCCTHTTAIHSTNSHAENERVAHIKWHGE